MSGGNSAEFFGPLKRRPKYSAKADGSFYSFVYFREHFRQEIIDDCGGRCVYCDCHEAEVGGREAMEVDHFRPWSRPKFAHLKDDPNNFHHGCPRCNRLKGAHWPSTKPDASHDGRVGFVDPFADSRSEFFAVNDDGSLACLKNPAAYIASLLQLDRPLLRRLRLRRLLRLELAKYINRMLPEIEAAKGGKGNLTREQIATEWIQLKDYLRLLELCDAPLKNLKAAFAQ